MNYLITGVQLTSIIVMGMASLSFSFFFPHKIKIGEVYNRSRHFLIWGTFLSALHFAIQLYLHVNYTHIEDTRTLVNMLLGMPSSFFFNISYLNLIRKGSIKKWEYTVFIVCYLLTVLLYGFHRIQDSYEFGLDDLTPIMATFFGITQIFYVTQILRTYHTIRKAIHKSECDPALFNLVQWTKWMTLFLIVVAFGYPIMAFPTHLGMRSLYGILAVVSSYYYISCFIGYGVDMQNKKMILVPYVADDITAAGMAVAVPTGLQEAPAVVTPSVLSASTEGTEVQQTTLSTETYNPAAARVQPEEWAKLKRENVEMIVNNFLKTDFYLQPGVKLKDVAEQMGISVTLLKTWLRTTPYEKFTNWLLAIRINRAKELMLNNPDYSSDEIALQCGFCDRQYFQAQFKKLIGISPTDWLKVQKPR